MVLKKIRLELARDEQFPTGNPERGYEFVAPIDNTGKINMSAWRKQRERCRVLRFWGTEEHEHGHLVRTKGGKWAFHYDQAGDIDIDDEAGYRFEDHHFFPGEYVSVLEKDGKLRTFHVTQVSEIPTK